MITQVTQHADDPLLPAVTAQMDRHLDSTSATLPPLHDLSALQQFEDDWDASGQPAEQLITLYRNDGSCLGYIRASNKAMRLNLHHEARAALQSAYRLAKTDVDRALVQVSTVSLKLHVNAANPRPSITDQRQDLDALLGSLHHLQTTGTADPMAMELEIRLLWCIAYLYNSVSHTPDSLPYVTRMKHLAFLMNNTTFEARADSLRMWALGNAGQYHDALVTARMNAAQRGSPAHSTVDAALLLANLGARQAAVDLLAAQDDANARSWTYFIESLYGRSDPEARPDIDPDAPPRHWWMTECLTALNRLSAQDPLRPKNLDRLRVAAGVFDRLTMDLRSFPPDDQEFATWVQTAAHLQLRNHGLARQTIQAARTLTDQQLLIRTLMASAKLDLALQIGHFEVETITRTEEELRQIFDQARNLSYASPEGLAQVMVRWHPLAAAYASVMPRPIPPLHIATASITHVKQNCTSHNLLLPPLYIAELILSAFHYTPAAELNAAMRKQRNQLLVPFGEASLWSVPVTSAQLVYGLLKASEDTRSVEHRAAAQRLTTSNGLTPALRSEFGQFELEQLEQAMRKWLAGQSDHAGFLHKLNV